MLSTSGLLVPLANGAFQGNNQLATLAAGGLFGVPGLLAAGAGPGLGSLILPESLGLPPAVSSIVGSMVAFQVGMALTPSWGRGLFGAPYSPGASMITAGLFFAAFTAAMGRQGQQT